MSAETLEWLNTNTLIGFAKEKGNAWHYDASLQGEESNHYPEAIPVDDVVRRLFHWEQVGVKATYQVGEATYEMPGLVIARSDTGATLGVHGDDYTIHQYPEWLLEKVGEILDTAKGDLAIGSAVLLMGGAVAAVQMELPDTVDIGGDKLRPFLLATTSANGKYASTYKRGTTRVVCDNTLSCFHNEAGPGFKVKHTKRSGDDAKAQSVRETLEITFKHFEAEQAEIARLMDMAVSDDQFWAIVKSLDPIKDSSTDKGKTRIQNRWDEYGKLWNHDNRIGNFKNTAWGVIQTFNTYQQHEASVWGKTIRPETNMLNFIGGKTDLADQKVTKTVLATIGG